MQLVESFLEHNSWVTGIAVPVLVGIAVLAIERYWHYRDKATKTLDFRVISDVPLFPDSNRPSDLKVRHFNNEVHDPRIVRVKFVNTGKRIIRDSEILDPYIIRRRSARLLTHDVVHPDQQRFVSRLEGLDPTVDGEDYSVAVYPGTLNARESFTIQLVYDGGGDEPVTVSGGRIEEETRPSRIWPTEFEQSRPRRVMWATAPGGLILLSIGIATLIDPTKADKHGDAITAVCFGIGMCLIGVGTWVVMRWQLNRKLRPPLPHESGTDT